MSPVAAEMRRLIARHGYRRYLILGPALVAAGMAWACFMPVHGNYPLHLLPALLMMGPAYCCGGRLWAGVYGDRRTSSG